MLPMSRQTLAVALIHFGIAALVITATTVLSILHDIDAQAVTALFGTAVGLVGGTGASFASVLRNGNGKPPAGTGQPA